MPEQQSDISLTLNLHKVSDLMFGSRCRAWRLGSGVAVFILTLAACTPSDSAPSPHPAEPPPASADHSTATPLATIPLEYEIGAIAYGFGGAWVRLDTDPAADPPTGDVVKIEAATGKVTETIAGASGVSIGPDAIWAVDFETLRKVDPASGETIFTVKAPGAYYVSVGAGAVWVTLPRGVGRIDPKTRALKMIPIKSAGALADVRATDDAVWIADKIKGQVLRLDPRTNKVVKEISTGSGAHGIAVDKNGVWVSNYRANTVSRIDPRTNRVVATIEGLGSAVGITACQQAVWASADEVGMFRIDPATNKATLVVPLPMENIYGLACGKGELWLGSWYKKQVYRYPL